MVIVHSHGHRRRTYCIYVSRLGIEIRRCGQSPSPGVSIETNNGKRKAERFPFFLHEVTVRGGVRQLLFVEEIKDP